jgi:hypothetical protein
MGGNNGLLTAIVGAALLAFGPVGWAAYLGKTLLTNAILGAVGRALQKKPSASGTTMAAQGRLETVRQALGPRQVVYGRVRVGGTLTFFETTTDNQTALMITTLTGHPVSNIRDVYYNDRSTLDYGSHGTGSAAGGKFAGYSTVYRSSGTEGASQPFGDLVARGLSWAATDLQRDCAKVHTTHAFSNEVWQTGLPQVSCVIDGVFDIIDPRLGSPTGTRWTNNPALCIAHYLASVNGLSADYGSEIDQATLIASANICDERVLLSGTRTATVADVQPSADAIVLAVGSVHFDFGDGLRFSTGSPTTLPGGISEGVTYYAMPVMEGDVTIGQYIRIATSYENAMAGSFMDISSTGSGTITVTHYDEPRYRLNGAFSLTEKPQAVIERMLMAMAGKLVNSGGVWYLYAGAYSTPTLTFDEDDFAGAIDVQTNLSRSENANAVKGTFVDPSSRYQPVDFPAVLSQTYYQEDGGERVYRDLDLTAFVTSSTQAQRLAKIDLITTRVGLTCHARFKLSAFRMMTGATVAISNTHLGWTAKAFEVMNCTLVIERDGRLEVDATLRETAAEIYDWNVSEEQLADLAPNTNLPDPTTVAAPTGLTFTQSETLPDRAALTWTAPSDSFIRDYQVEYKLAADSDWVVRPRIESVRYDLEKAQPGAYDFRVAAINIFGASSDYATTTGTIVSARVTSSYTGAQDGLGVTQLLGSGTASWAAVDSVLSMAFCPANNKIYGALEDKDPFSITPSPINAAPTLNRILRGKISIAVAYSPVTQYIYFSQDVALSGSPSPTGMFAIDPGSEQIVLANSALAHTIKYIMHCPSDGYLWCSATDNARVYVIDPADLSVVTTIYGLNAPKFMCYVPTTDQVWVGDLFQQKIMVVDIGGSPTYNTNIITITAFPSQVEGIAYCSTEDRVVVSRDNAALAFYDPSTRTIASSVNLGNETGQVLYNPKNDRIYINDVAASNRIYTVVPRTLNYHAESINIGGLFTEGLLNPVNNILYYGTNLAKVAAIST